MRAAYITDALQGSGGIALRLAWIRPWSTSTIIFSRARQFIPPQSFRVPANSAN